MTATLPVKGAGVFTRRLDGGGRVTTLRRTDFQGRDVLSRLIYARACR